MADPNRPVTGYPAQNANGHPNQPPPVSNTSYPYVAPQPPNYYNQPYYPPPAVNYQPDPYAARRAIFLRRVLAIIIAAFIIMGTSFFIVWLILRPRQPEFRIDSLSVSNFNYSSTDLLSADFQIGITARNPNSKITLIYEHLEADVFFQNWKLSDTTLPPFSQTKKNETSIRASAAAVNTYVDSDLVSAMNGQRSKNGNVSFNVRMFMALRMKAGAWFARRRYLKAFCGDLTVGFSRNSTNGTLIGGPKQCNVGFYPPPPRSSTTTAIISVVCLNREIISIKKERGVLLLGNKMKGGIFITLVVATAACWGLVAGDAVGDECANEFQKVVACLSFATGKETTPTKECCTSVADLKSRKPVCLCYIIQQIHDGSNPQIKSMNIQEALLLRLPSACKLTNASITECPKLLNLPPNSPDAAIFTSNGTTTPASPEKSSPETSSPTKTDGGSSSYTHGPQSAGLLVTAVAIFFLAFPTGLKLMPSF